MNHNIVLNIQQEDKNCPYRGATCPAVLTNRTCCLIITLALQPPSCDLQPSKSRSTERDAGKDVVVEGSLAFREFVVCQMRDLATIYVHHPSVAPYGCCNDD